MAVSTWEPARRLPLKWGHYNDRYYAGLVLIVAGAMNLQGANNYALIILLIGTASTAVGWAIMPARGWRRMIVILPAIVQTWVMLAGPMSLWTLTILLLCWLIVRHRPLISYIALALPIANGVILPRFYQEYSSMPQALAVSAVTLVAAAWLAQLIAHSASRHRRKSAIPSKTR